MDIHDYRGEMIYGGGYSLGKVTLSNSQLASCNADLLSFSADLTVTNCDFGICMTYVENDPQASMRFINCTFTGCTNNGLGFSKSPDDGVFAPGASGEIVACTFNGGNVGIDLGNRVSDVLIHDNTFNDVPIAIRSYATAKNISVYDNIANFTATNNNMFIQMWGTQTNWDIYSNTVNTQPSINLTRTLSYADNISGVHMHDNTFYNCNPPDQGWASGTSAPTESNNLYLTGTPPPNNVSVTGISVSPTTTTINTGATQQLTATVLPTNASNKNVTWSTSNASVATVSTSGLVTGVASGNATITVTTVDQGKTATSSIAVSVPSEGCSATGYILAERWDGISGTAVSNLTSNPSYPNSPTSSSNLTSMEIPTNVSDNYGVRIAGYICAPATGSYTFWIAGDDNVELWLSSNSNAANKTRIAYHTSWTNSRQWNKYTTQKSASITLTAGQNYYIEALMNEGGGGDNLAVGWLKPGQSGTVPSEVVPGSVLSPFTSGAISVTDVSVSPTLASINVGSTQSLTASVLPTNATNKNVTWSTSDASVATVSTTGLVTGVAAGNATITVTTADQNKTATSVITVAPIEWTVFTTQTPASSSNDQPYELGMKFTSTSAGEITKIRYYKMSGETGTHTGRIWSSTGTQLASVNFTSETSSGWQTAPLSTALSISANTTYVISVNCVTNYALTSNAMGSTINNGPLSSIAESNGVFNTTPGSFPNSSWNNSNYFRDVVFISNSSNSKLASEVITASTEISEIKIYPNPATNKVTIDFAKEVMGMITIRELSGKTLMKENIKGQTQQVLDVSGLSNGIYILTIDDGSKLKSHKITIDR